MMHVSVENLKTMNKERDDYIHTFSFESLNVRKEIEVLLAASNKVQRFTGDDLPTGVVIDTVFTHTQRAVSAVDLIPESFQNRKTTKKILLLHDLPEVFTVLSSGKTADVTSPQKEALPEYDQEIADWEYQVAESIFTPLEFNLYQQFEESGNYLKGKSFNVNFLTEAGIYSQLIDKTDANLTLHSYISNWALSRDYNPRLIKSERSLTYVFRQQQKFQSKLSGGSLDFYNSTVEAIKDLWIDVQESGVLIPQELISYIK